MDINPIVLSIPIYFLLIGLELLIQQFSKRKYYRLNDALTNISCGITQQLTNIFFKIVTVVVYQFIYENFALLTIQNNWLTYIILFVAVDFCYYWAHRMSHEINLFWGGHVVHHQSEDYNLSVALRQGSFQVIWTFAFYLPLAFIGFETLTFVTVSALVTVYQFWIHTETINTLGPLEWIFNTPSHHRVHHGRDPKYIDKNHAGVFIIWDKMFGTFQKEEEKPTYGITTPINSWNPFWVNFHHYINIVKNIGKANKFSDKIKILFKKPGWLPDDLGGYQAPVKVDKKLYHKYDEKKPKLNFYILFQYTIILSATALFLFNQKNMELTYKVFGVTYIILAIVNFGAFFELKKWAFTSEIVRLTFTLFISAWYLWIGDFPPKVLIIIITYSTLSLIWIVKFKKLFITQKLSTT